jgi:LmbE family N-acetylglucosaminyl deacetylase
MVWIYLSPHLDDATLSLGGLIWEQSQAGEDVRIWTLCAGDPPPGEFSPFAQALHARWGTGREAVMARRAEDMEACAVLGASCHHFEVPDCIYRRSPRTGAHLYADENALWSPVHPDEGDLVDAIGVMLQDRLSALPAETKLVSPLTLGDHVDHRLTRTAAERVGVPLYFYADYPYVLGVDLWDKVSSLKSIVSSISPEGMGAWQKAIARHRSQISTFWGGRSEMQIAIQTYYDQIGGIWLGDSSGLQG